MNISQTTRDHGSFRLTVAIAAICLAAVSGGAAPAYGLDLEGFMEPYRTINIAAEETGIIESSPRPRAVVAAQPGRARWAARVAGRWFFL